MAFGYDGSVRIKADLNHSNFDRGLSYMTKQVNTFGSTLKKIGGMVAIAFGTAALVNFAKESIKLASDIQEVQNVIDVTFGNGAAQIEEFAQTAAEAYGLSELAAKQYTGTMGAMLKSSGLSTSAAQEMSMALTGLAGDIASFYNLDTDTAFEKIRAGISGETEPLKQLGINMSVANLEAYALSKGITKSYNAMSQAEQVLLRYNYLLSVTTDAQGDFARTSGSFANQIRILQLNFDQLRISVGNALIPIAEAVLPSINAIIAGLTKLANVFAKVTALLFGKSPEVKATSGIAASAGAAADATDKLAESTAGAGSAAKQAEKDMKGVLASFDELNILASNAAGSVGGAGGGGGGASAPDLEIPSYEAEIEDVDQLGEAFESLGELFVKTLDDILAGMPAFKQALLDFAAGFNEFNQKLYDAFTFPGVKERVEELGRELADAFNGLVNAINWELWGRTLGAGLNLGLQFLTEFLYTFDWINLGKRFAEFINGLVYEVDWYDFGRLLWTHFKLALETFAGFILGLDMPALAQAASDIAKGFFDSMQESIANIDWAGIGRQIAEFLNNIDWVGVINSIAGALQEMVGAALEMLGGFIQNADTGTLIAAAIFFGSKLLRSLISKVLIPIGKQVADNLLKKVAESITTSGTASLISTALKGLLGGISIAVGISLVVSSIKDITVNGANFKNVVTGLIGGALVGAGVGFFLGGPAGVALGAVIGVGLTLSLEGVVSQIAHGVDLFGALATIIGTVFAGAGIGFAVSGGNIAGAGVGAAIGLTASIFLEITGIRAAGESAYAATEDFRFMTDIIKECEESSNRSSAAMQTLAQNVDGLTSSLADVGAAQALVDEIYAINDNASASAQELELMATKVDLLNNLGLDGLHLTIDETTGRIIETKEATDQLIISLQKEAETAALQELLVQAYKDRYQAVMDAEKATRGITEAEKALADTERELTDTPWWDLQKHAELTAQQEKQTEALEAATDARDAAVTAYNDLSGAIDTYSVSLTDLSGPEANVGVELEKRMESVRGTVEQMSSDMPAYGEGIGGGLENGIAKGTEPIGPMFSEFLSETAGAISDTWGNVDADTTKQWSEIRGNLNTTWTDVDKDAKGKFSGVKNTITSEMDGLKNHNWASIGSSIMNGIKGGMESSLSSISTWARSAGNRLANALKGTNSAASLQGSVRSYASGSYALPEAYSAHNLPHLANGAVIPPNQQFAAILGDQRSGKNLEAPAGLIRQMVAEGSQAAGGVGRGGDMTIIMEIDGREFGRASYRYGTAEQQRVGVRLVEVRT